MPPFLVDASQPLWIITFALIFILIMFGLNIIFPVFERLEFVYGFLPFCCYLFRISFAWHQTFCVFHLFKVSTSASLCPVPLESINKSVFSRFSLFAVVANFSYTLLTEVPARFV